MHSIEGKATPIAADAVAIQLGQVGSCVEIIVQVPRSQIAALEPLSTCKLFTRLIWRETGPALFGFATLAQVALFEQLNDVAGVGPKTALSLIDKLGEKGLAWAIDTEDFASLSCVAGVGKKTAQRIVIDLKGKCERSAIPSSRQLNSVEQQALSALVHLGYSQSQSKKLVQRAIESEPDLSASDLIKLALRMGRQ